MNTWIEAKRGSTVRLAVENAFFATSPHMRGHVFIEGDRVTISNVTLFAGHLTNVAALRWALFGILRLGPVRRERIRRFLHIKQKGARS